MRALIFPPFSGGSRPTASSNLTCIRTTIWGRTVVQCATQSSPRRAAWRGTWSRIAIKGRTCVRIVTRRLRRTWIVGSTWKYISTSWRNGSVYLIFRICSCEQRKRILKFAPHTYSNWRNKRRKSRAHSSPWARTKAPFRRYRRASLSLRTWRCRFNRKWRRTSRRPSPIISRISARRKKSRFCWRIARHHLLQIVRFFKNTTSVRSKSDKRNNKV